MREILFKVREIKTKDWIEGFLTHNKETGKSWLGNFAFGSYYHTEVIPETVCQFTGRLIEGKELYEGDIVQFRNSGLIKIIEYRQANNAFCMVNKSDFENESIRKWLGEGIYSNPGNNWWRDFGTDLKIIGNIHD